MSIYIITLEYKGQTNKIDFPYTMEYSEKWGCAYMKTPDHMHPILGVVEGVHHSQDHHGYTFWSGKYSVLTEIEDHNMALNRGKCYIESFMSKDPNNPIPYFTWRGKSDDYTDTGRS